MVYVKNDIFRSYSFIKKIKFDKGLTELEILKVKSIYNFNFPYNLKIFLKSKNYELFFLNI